MNKVLCLSSLFLGISLAACAPSRPAGTGSRGIQLAVVENSEGVEVQAPEPWRAEEYMRHRCPHGFTVVKRQEVLAHLTPVSDDSFDRLTEPNELVGDAPITEQRTTFKCRPFASEVESTAIVSSN